ncbi:MULTISPECIES: hypothetical protein [Acinetobacter]|nr:MULTISPECIES: hypothetical protein [Acinetobacter]MAK29933.1 hypothetical protein [Acinetobacter sp.]UXJ56651.1 hypothetical protein N5P16_12355 [Acinetobacter baylyi]UXJ61849.1 hypothetical protein N5P13_06420 [Acinetobacter baylyi]
MDLIKFLKSFNTVNTYLLVTSLSLMSLVIYFYVISPK